MMKSKALLFIPVATLLFFCAIESSAQPIIDQIRKQALETLGPDKQGEFYAGLINFSIHPDISTATYNIKAEGADDPILNVYRIPLQYVFTLEGQNWRPLVRANLAYTKLDTGFEFNAVESIDAD